MFILISTIFERLDLKLRYMRVKVLLIVLCVHLGVMAQDAKKESKKQSDQIVMLSGEKIPCDVIKIYSSKIRYRLDGVKRDQYVKKDNVEKVIYRTGKIRTVNKPAFKELKEDDYRMIFLTDNEDDVAGMYPRKEIIVRSAKSSRSSSAARKSAEIKIRKKAVRYKAVMVLITSRERQGGFGEPPSYIIKGIPYCSEPEEKKENKQ